VVAIGECGLDFSRMPSSSGGTAADDEMYLKRQARLFEQQLELAVELGLNVIIHQRNSFAETMEQLRPYAARLRAVFHCFVGTPDEQKQVAAMGSLVSFTGIATFKNAATVRETIRATPLSAASREAMRTGLGGGYCCVYREGKELFARGIVPGDLRDGARFFPQASVIRSVRSSGPSPSL
jgi:hypothetical protein